MFSIKILIDEVGLCILFLMVVVINIPSILSMLKSYKRKNEEKCP